MRQRQRSGECNRTIFSSATVSRTDIAPAVTRKSCMQEAQALRDRLLLLVCLSRPAHTLPHSKPVMFNLRVDLT